MTPNNNISTNADSPCSDSTDLPSQPPLNDQLGFITALHPDIVLTIFSNLSQEDCLTCMAVCRDWYRTVPQYTEEIWKTITFTARDVYAENHRRVRCLGDHVKSVTMHELENENDVYHVMRKLLDWGCTKVKSLEFNHCLTDDQDAFLDVLTKLAPHLTHLEMINHRSNLAFLHVFHACPELTHFTYEIRMRDWWRSEVYDKEPVVSNATDLSSLKLTTKITHMCLDLIMKPDRVYRILRNCPELRCYVGPSKRATVCIQMTDNDFGYNNISIDIDRLFDMCPKINHVQPYFTLSNIEELGDVDYYTNDPKSTGLRNLDICEDYGGDRIATWLLKNQDTLQRLSLQAYHDEYQFDWSPIFCSLQLTQLHVLDLDVLHYDTASLVALLRNCPLLETIVLNCKNQTFNPSTIQAISPLYRLRSLKCNSLYIDDICLKMLLDRFPLLEKLSLTIATISLTVPRYMGYATNQLKHLDLWSVEWKTNDDDDTSYKEEAIARFFNHWTVQSKIEILSFTFVQMFGTKALLSIADTPTLKDCNMILDPTRFDEDEFFQFANKLHGTAIEKLSLRGIKHMSFDVLNTLAELRSLRELDLPQLTSRQCVCKVDVPGLLQILCRSVSLKIMTLQHVLLEGMSDHSSLSALIEPNALRYYVQKEEKCLDTELSVVVYDVTVKSRA